MSLGELFSDSGESTVEVNGQLLHSAIAIEVDGDCVVEVARRTHRRDRVQTLNLRLGDGSFEINGVVAASVCLRSDTAPDHVTLVVASETPTTLWAWNGWIESETHQAWVGDAGIAHSVDGPRHTLECSDGLDGPVFDDLVVTIEINEI